MPHHFLVLPAEVWWATQPNLRRGQDVAGCYGMLMRGCRSIVCSWLLISPWIRQTDRGFISAVYIQGGSELLWMITYNRAEPSAQCVYLWAHETECLFTKHKLLRVWKQSPPPPQRHRSCLTLARQKHQFHRWSPLNTYKHIKHGCLRCPSMTAFMAGLRNERRRALRVAGVEAWAVYLYREVAVGWRGLGGITLQAEPSSLRCVLESEDQSDSLPLLACLCCATRGPRCQDEEITGFCIWEGVGGWSED